MDPAQAARLKSMTRAERNAEFDQMRIHPPASKWEFENAAGEAELAAIVEELDREKSREQNNA
jgi:hypothetical protein